MFSTTSHLLGILEKHESCSLKYGPVFPGLAILSALGNLITKYIEMTIYFVIWTLFWPVVSMF